MDIEAIKTRLLDFEFVDFVGPQTEEIIRDAEVTLGVTFPPSYRSFLKEFGAGGVDSEEVVGLGGPEHLDIVKLTRRFRERAHHLPNNLLPLRNDGFGNYDCIHLDLKGDDEECAIVQWSHEGDSEQDCDVISPSFYSWFDSLLVMIEEELAG